jgi:hypothetical protein
MKQPGFHEAMPVSELFLSLPLEMRSYFQITI